MGSGWLRACSATRSNSPRIRLRCPRIVAYPSACSLMSLFLFLPALSLAFSLILRSCCATHRHHLTIHLGPVLLITRLGLRTRNRGLGNSGDVPVPLKRNRRGTPEHGTPHRSRVLGLSLSLSLSIFVLRQACLFLARTTAFLHGSPLRVLCTRPASTAILYAEYYSTRRASYSERATNVFLSLARY